jgi:ankyrin repeat protein
MAEEQSGAAAGTSSNSADDQKKQEEEKHELVKLLIQRKADCTKQNANGETPLIKAVKKKYATICQVFLVIILNNAVSD